MNNYNQWKINNQKFKIKIQVNWKKYKAKFMKIMSHCSKIILVNWNKFKVLNIETLKKLNSKKINLKVFSNNLKKNKIRMKINKMIKFNKIKSIKQKKLRVILQTNTKKITQKTKKFKNNNQTKIQK